MTSGGIDRGARPICEDLEIDAEKEREKPIGKAGRRKDGRETEADEPTAFPRPLDLAVESIVSKCYSIFLPSRNRAP